MKLISTEAMQTERTASDGSRSNEGCCFGLQVSITSYKSEEPQDCAFAVDDLTVDPGHCKPAPQDGSCDFDWGEACGYNVDNHSERWSLHDGMMAEKPGFETVRNDATVGTLYG